MSQKKLTWLRLAIATAFVLPSVALASGGKMPDVARQALKQRIRADLGRNGSTYQGKLSINRSKLSKKLESTSTMAHPDPDGRGGYAKGRAYVYNARKGKKGKKGKKVGSYFVVESYDRESDSVSWEAHPFSRPLTQKGKPSKKSTKSITRPKAGGGYLDANFISEGDFPPHKTVVGVHVKNATVAEAANGARVLAKRVNEDGSMFFVARGARSQDTAGKAEASLRLYGSQQPDFSGSAIRPLPQPAPDAAGSAIRPLPQPAPDAAGSAIRPLPQPAPDAAGSAIRPLVQPAPTPGAARPRPWRPEWEATPFTAYVSKGLKGKKGNKGKKGKMTKAQRAEAKLDAILDAAPLTEAGFRYKTVTEQTIGKWLKANFGKLKNISPEDARIASDLLDGAKAGVRGGRSDFDTLIAKLDAIADAN